jgi:hypothetical protein
MGECCTEPGDVVVEGPASVQGRVLQHLCIGLVHLGGPLLEGPLAPLPLKGVQDPVVGDSKQPGFGRGLSPKLHNTAAGRFKDLLGDLFSEGRLAPAHAETIAKD